MKSLLDSIALRVTEIQPFATTQWLDTFTDFNDPRTTESFCHKIILPDPATFEMRLV